MFTRNEALVLAAACAAVLVGLAVPGFRPGPPPVVVEGSPEPLPTLRPAAPSGPVGVSVNLATAEELERLPGIGPVLARRIVEDRSRNGQYRRVEDLLRVKGIGPRTLEKLRPYVRVP
jgi:competence protein ComEA